MLVTLNDMRRINAYENTKRYLIKYKEAGDFSELCDKGKVIIAKNDFPTEEIIEAVKLPYTQYISSIPREEDEEKVADLFIKLMRHWKGDCKIVS